MKLIKNIKSPNFNSRNKKKVKFIIIHYTALKNYKEAISFLCNPKNNVSSHFLISQKGDIYNLVDVNKRAWHAGLSYWNGYRDLNSISIGIELDFSYSNKNNKYSHKMITALIKTIKKLKEIYNIKDKYILGHSDIAPFRKIDPGPKFPWYKLYSANLGFNPIKNKSIKNVSIIRWFTKNKVLTRKDIALFILNYIGYDIADAKTNKKSFSNLVLIYQNHYIQNNPNGKIDKNTFDFLTLHFLNLVLTKN